MNPEIKTLSFKEEILIDYNSNKDVLFGSNQNFIANQRKAAIKSFETLGIPTKKHEEYKYLNMEALLKKNFSTHIVSPNNISQKEIDSLKIVPNAINVVVVNGEFHKELSDKNFSEKIFIGSLTDALDFNKEVFEKYFGKNTDVTSDSFIALNTALAKGGVFIHIPENIVFDQPIHIIHIVDTPAKGIIQPRNLIVAGKNSEATIIESFVSIESSGSFTNVLTEVFVSENAKVEHYRIQNESGDALQLNTTQAYQEGNSVYRTYTFTLGGALVRNNLMISLGAENCESHLYGLYLPKENQVVDNHTLVDHRMPHCYSNELYKGIMNDKSTAVFNGKIFVRKDAQKTNAFQSNKNVLLSDDATINTKPQLEIYADDVKCSHGTSTGKIDEEALFYLRARGIGEEDAKKLLMHAFADEVVDTIRIPELREFIRALVSKKF